MKLPHTLVVASFVLSFMDFRSANATEIKILSSSNMKPILAILAGEFERTTGHRLLMQIVEAVPVRDRIRAGETPAVAITERRLLDELGGERKLLRGSIVNFARSTVSMMVRAGSPKPDISTVASFTRSVLEANSLAYPDPAAGGLAGIYFSEAITRLGISDQLKPKSKLMPTGEAVGQLVGSGGASLGVAQTSTARAAKGTEIVGTLPRELGVDIIVSVGIVNGSPVADAARAFVDFLSSPTAVRAIKTGGMETE